MKRIVPLISGMLIYLFIGLIYAWSIFVAPIEADFGWTRTETSATFTISMTCFCIGGILSGFILKRKSGRFVLLLAAILLFAGFILSSQVNSIIALYISYGVFCGLGVGLAYNATISTVTKWYPDRLGFISGLLLMCFGFGGLLLGSLASSLITYVGWRTTFIVLGVLFAAIILLCSFFIVLPKEPINLAPKSQKVPGKAEEGLVLSSKEMLGRSSFWLQFLWATFLIAAGLAVIGHAALFSQEIGASVYLATIITGMISVSNGAGRVIAGLVYDRFGRKTCVRYDNIAMVTAFLVLIAALQFSSLPILFLGGILIGIAYGSMPSTSSAYVSQFYGSKHYALNFSIMNLNIIPAAFLGPLVAGAIKTATGSYMGVFVLLLGLSIVTYVFQLFIKRP